MIAISKTFPLQHAPLHHSRGQHNTPRSLVRDSGIGLAVILTVLIMTVVGTWGSSGVQTVGSWPGVEAPKPTTGWGTSVLPESLPLGPVTSNAAM
jgi:hypothetical protein